jgi:hypothetical protein
MEEYRIFSKRNHTWISPSLVNSPDGARPMQALLPCLKTVNRQPMEKKKKRDKGNYFILILATV